MNEAEEEVPANFVPAAAVKRGGQVLFIRIGRKGSVDGREAVWSKKHLA